MRPEKKEDTPEENTADVEANFYYALSHEIRRKIIKIIGDNEFTSFTQLKRELGVSTGTIYHHLDSLAQLIEQKKNKKYYLTDLGVHAYKSLKDNIDTIETPSNARREFNSPLLRALMALTPKSYLYFKDEDKKYVVIVSSTILIIGAILCGLNGFISFLFFFGEGTEDLASLPVEFHVLFSFFFIINVFVFFFIVEMLSRLFYKKSENALHLLISFGIIFFPMVFYLLFHFLFVSMEIIEISSILIFDRILMIFFQVWSLWLLTYNLSITKNIKIENGLIITFLLHYGGFTIILFSSI
ncbi:MAG: ArsR family transcriptional regulator [Promethearchaeota archaeon]|nr:MAG: ArsR family transcriptional regulator [Candidatus Lokiarchaeota archaeon]